ncbi:MAG: sigma-70 family RNA polymerase sigma factor [Phycisphaerae bacterium]|nr:sigma-70 family RNA polymerase sigma factor [Phycisphaerae bacterium]MCZ2399926.1 sigma-70 family RNA polymerase sigma factor [Phycisphaerae bacterium]
MLASQQSVAAPDAAAPATVVRKHEPTAGPPAEAVLRSLDAFKRRRLQIRLGETAEYVYDPLFEQPDCELRLLGPMPPGPAPARPRRRSRSSDDSGVDLLAPAPRGSLTSEQERHLFLRLNYARYRLFTILERNQARPLGAEDVRELLKWDTLIEDTRNEIVRYNVPLVLAMAKRTKITGVDHSDLISEGNLALLRSVDKFDTARGFKFSTYACRAILKSFSRVATRTARYRGHFPTEFDPTLEKSNHQDERRRVIEDACVNELRAILGSNVANLNEVEKQVILARFAIDPTDTEDPPRAKTLEQVGEMIGVTKERVRQIQNKALNKLKTLLEDGVLAL